MSFRQDGSTMSFDTLAKFPSPNGDCVFKTRSILLLMFLTTCFRPLTEIMSLRRDLIATLKTMDPPFPSPNGDYVFKTFMRREE